MSVQVPFLVLNLFNFDMKHILWLIFYSPRDECLGPRSGDDRLDSTENYKTWGILLQESFRGLDKQEPNL